MIVAYRNGERCAGLPLDSRAAHYGDGAFSTMRVHAGQVCWWPAHRARFEQACAALHLRAPDWSGVEALLEAEAQRHGQAVFKLALVPRGEARGYARTWPSACDVYLFVHAAPEDDAAVYRDGVVATFASEPLGSEERAGTKSLSRLEQVLVAPVAPAYEAICCDRDGFVLAARSANLFARFASTWVTPPTGGGVVAGVTRATLLQSPPPGFSVRVQAMHRDALRYADALILTNAVRGIVPLARLGEREYGDRAGVDAWMQRFHPELGLPVH
jgi:4-amino-4-deoxychorismate lyase